MCKFQKYLVIFLIAAILLPILPAFGEEASRWASWTKNSAAVVTIDGDDAMTMSSNDGALAQSYIRRTTGDNFEIEARIKVNAFSGECGFQVMTGKHRLFMRLNESNFVYFTGNGTSGSNVNVTVSYPIGKDWHDYYIRVANGVASIFIDENFVTNASIQTNNGTPTILLYGRSAAGETCSLTAAYINYIAPGGDEVVSDTAAEPVYFDFSENHDGWTADKGGVSYDEEGMKLSSTYSDNTAQLVTYNIGVERDFDFEFRARVDNAYGQVASRVQWGGHRIMFYLFGDYVKYWAADGQTQYTFRESLIGQWHTWRFEVRDDMAVIYLDGELLTSYTLPSWDASVDTLAFFVSRMDGEHENGLTVDYAKYTPILYDFDLKYPFDGSAYLEGSPISFASVPSNGSEGVDYYANGEKIGEGNAPDYHFSWTDAPAGEYTVSARSADGTAITPERRITVQSPFGVMADCEEAYDFGEDTILTVDAKNLLGQIANTEFYLDGRSVSKADGAAASYSYGVLQPGVHTLYAAVTNEKGEVSYSSPKAVTVTAYRKDIADITLPDMYLCDFTATGSGSAEVLLADGSYACRVNVGEFGAGSYRIMADGGVYYLYYNGKPARSEVMERTEENTVTITENGITISDFTISGEENMGYYYADTAVGETLSREIVHMPQEYTLEFDLTLNEGTQTVTVSDGVFLSEMVFDQQGITVQGSPNGKANFTESDLLGRIENPNKRRIYRLQVSRGLAQLFADGEFAGSFRLPEAYRPAGLELQSQGGAEVGFVTLKKMQDQFYFTDGFENDGAVDSVKYWNVYSGTWDVAVDGAGNRFFVSGIGEEESALLYAIDKNPVFGAKVSVAGTPVSGGVYMTARYNTEMAFLYTGYDFATKSYRIIERFHTNERVVAEAAGTFPAGVWNDMQLTLDDETLILTVNGETVLTSSDLDYIGYGKIGFIARGCQVSVDDVTYIGGGRPVAGVDDVTITGIYNTDIFEKEDGTLVIAELRGNTRQSSDRGMTWTAGDTLPNHTAANKAANIARLKNGNLLMILREEVGTLLYRDVAYISENDGKTFHGPYVIEKDSVNRVTMNGRISQGASGRIYFTQGEMGDGNEEYGEVGMYYSDDGGITWSTTENHISFWDTNMNMQEAKAIELPDGRVRIYMRSVLGFDYYAESVDGCKTWDYNFRKSQFISPKGTFNIEQDPYTGLYYFFWVYDNKNEHPEKHWPRYRVALAVSEDCDHWEYVGDIDEFDYNTSTHNRFINLDVNIFEDAVYLDCIRMQPTTASSDQITTHVYRVNKEDIMTAGRFSYPHIRGESEVPFVFR